MNWVLNLFRRTRRPNGNVTYPFRPLLEAMHRKDAALAEEVGPMIPSMAAERWREVYPDDFPGGLLIIHESGIKK